MGGAQSLLNENDWETADGGLASCEETVDGAEPTGTYRTYNLWKRAVLGNQREFDVTDSERNLLYYVQASPGTIAGFDVLGVGSALEDDYILRVTVDLARRHWTVYRFDAPVFVGQRPDPAATEKFAIEQQTDRKVLAARISASLAIHSFSKDGLDPAVSARPPPIQPKNLLYKVCCVTVSWSRYMAVAAYYGPPTAEQMLQASARSRKEDADSVVTSDSEGDRLLEAASKISQRMRDRSPAGAHADDSGNANAVLDDAADEEVDEASLASSGTDQDENAAAASDVVKCETVGGRSLADDLVDESESSVDEDEETATITESLSVQDAHGDEDSALEIQTAASMPELLQGASASPKRKLRKWLKEQSRSLHETSKTVLRKFDDSDASSAGGGYSSFFGVSKPDDDPLQGVVHLDKPLLLCQEIYTRIIGNHQTSRVSKQIVLTLLKEDMKQHVQEGRDQDDNRENDKGLISVVNAVGVDALEADSAFENVVEEPESKRIVDSPRGDQSTAEEALSDCTEQPLVGYWAWENTMRTHKMKMHLAKGADLALHVVLAVIVNQVRYERNAIAMVV